MGRGEENCLIWTGVLEDFVGMVMGEVDLGGVSWWSCEDFGGEDEKREGVEEEDAGGEEDNLVGDKDLGGDV